MRKVLWVPICTAFLLLSLYFLGEQRHRSPKGRAETKGPVKSEMPADARKPDANDDAKAEVFEGGISSAVSKPALQVTDRKQQAIAAAKEMNVPINFWGKVIDQDGKEIAGAQIQLALRRWGSDSPTSAAGEFYPISRETDSDGRFELTGESGDVLEIQGVKKEGYRLSPTALTSLNFARAQNVSDPRTPVVFKMWKMGAKENLVVYHKSTRIPCDGSPIILDLIKGEKHVGAGDGDLRVSLLRSPLSLQFGSKERYDWNATIEAVDGGIVEPDSEFMYRAPELGYRPKLEIKMPASADSWVPTRKLSFFVKSRGGQCYGRAELEFSTDWPKDGGIIIDSTVNPAGSRNLEPAN